MTQEDPVVGDVMSKTAVTVELNVTAKDCARAMANKGVGCAVITQEGSAIGIVTERDLVSKVMAESIEAKKVLVRDIMSTPLITIGPDAPLAGAAEVMTRYRVRRLVVVDGEGALVGVITTGDVARSLAEKQGYREATLNAMARYSEGKQANGPYQ